MKLAPVFFNNFNKFDENMTIMYLNIYHLCSGNELKLHCNDKSNKWN